MKIKSIVLFTVFALPLNVFASAVPNTVECFPKTDLRIPHDGVLPFAGITQTEFNKILTNVENVYAPIFAAKGARLEMVKNWQSAEINAFASRSGNTWRVEMLGGLARHREVTAEGLYAVACHEIGHHVGGAPLYTTQGNTWAATEGQSDYFAALKCLRKVFRTVNLNELARDARVRERCERSFTDETEIRICEASTLGAESLARLSNALSGNSTPPSIDTPDPRQVSTTFETHPQGQCRLDTGFQASLCTVSDSVDTDPRNPDTGTCNRRENFAEGIRPRCWFKPAVDGGGDDDDDDGPGNPGGDIANAPLLNGQSNLSSNNPWASVTVQYDVSSFQAANAGGVYIEVSQPNRSFSNPNGASPDPQALGGVSIANLRGSYTFLPGRQLPNWGEYQIRIIPLDRTGRNAVGKFSNSATLSLQQQRRFGRSVGMRRSR